MITRVSCLQQLISSAAESAACSHIGMPLCQARTAQNSMRNGYLLHRSLLLLHPLLQLLQVVTLQQSASGAALEVALLPQALPGLGGSTASPQTPGPAHSALSAVLPQSQTQRELQAASDTQAQHKTRVGGDLCLPLRVRIMATVSVKVHLLSLWLPCCNTDCYSKYRQ